MILEMMGRPKEHVEKFMQDFLEKIGMEKGIKITKTETHKPKIIERKDKEGKKIEVKEGEEMYSLFSEIEVESETISDFTRVVFAYLPSHVEIISPTDFSMENFEVNSLFNEISRKLHEYDAIAKRALMENQILQNKFIEYMKRFPPKKKEEKDN